MLSRRHRYTALAISLLAVGGLAVGIAHATGAFSAVDAPSLSARVDAESLAPANVQALDGMPLAVRCPSVVVSLASRCAALSDHVAQAAEADPSVYVRVDHGGLADLAPGTPIFAEGELLCSAASSQQESTCSTIRRGDAPTLAPGQSIVAGYQRRTIKIVGDRGYISPPNPPSIALGS